ncbi:MAG TPA: PQQ-binding-like beta-propeller repeat protein [Pirellulales bacterium]|nr:PQQ-binding-like beta-propeller repeat protein [Pirellulales bacterium]
MSLVGASTTWAQGGRTTLITEQQARRFGLTRAWATRIKMDSSRNRVHEITLHQGALISVTDESMVQAFDAETGRTLWTTLVGQRSFPNTPVGASASYVCVCNGSTLYVLSRRDGSLLFTRKLQGTPSAAPTVSDTRVYVPTFAGAVESYEIKPEKPKLTPTTYRTKGSIDESPVLAGDYLVWGTHAGGVYSANKDDLNANYRFMTRGPITAGLGYWPPLVYAASADGYIYAIDEKSGKRRWQFSTGYPARQMPVPLDGNVYAIAELSGMHCLAADSGNERWFSADVAKFIAASRTRLYTADEQDRLVIVDRRSGAHLGRMATELLPIKVENTQTDRVYLATDTGLLQCLHEIDQVKPLVHELPPDPEATPAGGRRAPAAAAAAAPGAAADREMEADAPADAAADDDPFGAAAQP